MRILITGFSGVVGNEIANFFIKEKKHKLYIFSKRKIKKKKSFTPYYQDLTKTIKYKFRVDAVVHCAVKKPSSRLNNNLNKMYKNNIIMVKNLIEFSNNNKVKKFIFLSAMDVYGNIKKKILKENYKALNPNLYGQSKIEAEKMLCDKKNKFKSICLRLPGIFTSNLKKNRPLIVNIAKKMTNNRAVYAYNLKSKFNNTTDSYEISKFINFALKRKIKRSNCYNFSASKPIKFIQVINLIKKIFKSKSKIIERKSNSTSFIISNIKIKKKFNYKISTTTKIITRCCQRILEKN